MLDVARLAGVSEQTVSRVSRGRTNVLPDTRERVRAAMRELGYRPNRAARALKSGRFRNIAVMAYFSSSYGTAQWISSVTLEAARAGYSVTLVALESAEPAAVARAFDVLAEHAVDGAVLLVEEDGLERAGVNLPPGLPAVVLDSGVDSPYPVIDNDQAMGARLATRHLLDLGHRTVRHLAGPLDSRAAAIREAAWRETLEAAGATIAEAVRGDWSPEAGYTAGLDLAADPDVTAIFVANDQMALGVLRALRDSGRRVPEDVSVVGFDDVPESANYQPPLTTVHQSFDRIGATCVSVLVDEIERGERHFPPLVPVELVIRASTGRPPGR
ncbi:LacI family DNA-binding transcriptional regulator [Myceligenerans halotolerans]